MKKNLIKFQFSKNKSINSISRFMLSGIFLISFFYVTPLCLLTLQKKVLIIKNLPNNSKNLLLKKLNTNNLIEEDITGEVDEMDLLYDILEENNSEINLSKVYHLRN